MSAAQTARRATARRDLWLPALVALVGMLMSLALWGMLVAQRRAQLMEATTASAAETREVVERVLEDQVVALEGLVDLWNVFGVRRSEEWAANVNLRIDQIAGLDSVIWVDARSGHSLVAAGSGRAAESVELDMEAILAHRSEPQLVGPDRDTAGRITYRVFLPVADSGVVAGRFDAGAVLASALRARARGHALEVHWKEHEIFARGAPSEDPWQDWWRVEEAVDLPLGGSWRVVHRPTRELASTLLTPVPHYLLIAALILSLVLAILSHQLRLTIRQSRFLAASNRSLELRGHELESRVAERTEALEEAVAELEAFNYSVSHDLRSPLGAILNFAAILEEDYRDRPLDESGLAILARIRRSAMRATDLLQDLLQLSRAGRAALSFERLDMEALAHETYAQVRAAHDESGVELRVDPLPEAVGDRSLIADVLANLFSNALKYSREVEKRRIHVTGRIDGGECVYEVCDNGQGFDMRFEHKLFGLFERLHSADEIEGTGIGLAMVSRIVKRHGGRVWAQGQPGEGARFSFSLPRPEAT